MDFNLPNKSSSRAGRFKKKLVTEEVLLTEVSPILAKFSPFHELFIAGSISPPDFVACYILIYLSHRYPGTWLGSKKMTTNTTGTPWRDLPFFFEPNILKRLEAIESLNDIFSNFALKSTPLAVNRAILSWSKGDYGLELMFRIPRPHEVLHQQVNGRRCVTAIIDKRISKYILGERDALSFIMHDLIHADHFYYQNDSYQGQLGFYALLNHTISYFDLSNKAFASEFEYLIADMNAYAIHLLKCLKSSMIHYFSDDYFENWTKNLAPPPSLFLLNTKDYVPQTMDAQILTWLRNFQNQNQILTSNLHLP